MSKNNTIKIIRTTTANLASLLLNPGELAIDTTTQKLYCGTNGATFTDQLTPLNNSISLVDVLEAIYPVGALYFANTSSTTCPLETLGFGTWQLVAQDACIQGSSTNHASGTSLNACLPNISGNTDFSVITRNSSGTPQSSRVLYATTSSKNVHALSGSDVYSAVLGIDASRASAIYGNTNGAGSANAMQPKAYVVNIWERISPPNNTSQYESVIIIPDEPDTPDEPEEP